MNNVKLGLLPPWSTFINKVEAMFDGDPQIACNVEWDSKHPSIVLATNNPEKATALLNLLPEEVQFGNVTLNVGVDCSTYSNRAFTNPKELFETAFSGNPAFEYVVSSEGNWFIPLTYVVFKNYVVQYYNDVLDDPHGVESTLYQNIAAEIFAEKTSNMKVAYCTALENEVTNKSLMATPTGAWDIDVTTGIFPQTVATAISKLNENVGAVYEPIAYLGSQVVNGINHAVLAEQTILTGRDTKNIVLIIFNEKVGNETTVVNIERLIEGGKNGFGGIDIKVDISEEAMSVFNKAIEGFVGTKIEPKALLATHVTTGINYAFLVEMSTFGTDKKAGIVVVNDLTNSVKFTDILNKPSLGYAFNW